MNVILGLVLRHALTAIAGILAAKGYIDGGAVEGIASAAFAIAGVAFSIIEKSRR